MHRDNFVKEFLLFVSMCKRVLTINKLQISIKNPLENSHEFAFI